MSIKVANSVQVPPVITEPDIPLRMPEALLLPMSVQMPGIESLLIAPPQADAMNSSSMLSQVIGVTSRTAQSVTRLTTLPGISDVVGVHAAQLLNSTVPAVESLQRALNAFAAASRATVMRDLSRVNAGEMPSSLAAELQGMRQVCQAVSAQMARVFDQANQTRSMMTQDGAMLANKRVEYCAKRASLNSQLEHYPDEEEALRKRDLATTVVGTIIPLVKVADEIACLVQHRKSTEAALSKHSGAWRRWNSRCRHWTPWLRS
jgi:hypothetical protein